MNQNQSQQVTDQITLFNALDIDEIIASMYPGVDDSETLTVKGVNIPKFVATCRRVVRQLEAELNNGLGLSLPFEYKLSNGYGTGNLYDDLNDLNKHIQNKDIPGAVIFLKRLIYYQVTNGFYDKSTIEASRLRGSKIKKTNHSEQLDFSEENEELFKERKNFLNGFIAREVRASLFKTSH